jgi:hypothetical protein
MWLRIERAAFQASDRDAWSQNHREIRSMPSALSADTMAAVANAMSATAPMVIDN